MKNFKFKSIWLLSREVKRAQQARFHDKKNLILGRNHTGKSSLIKTLFKTLGARPQGELAQWDESIISVVDFTINEVAFKVIHQLGNRALFTGDNQFVLATSTHKDWTKAFADLLGFNLSLTDKKSNIVPADPRCLFLPFYINQDGSWFANWSTFVGLEQYKTPIKDILEYFSGIKPPKYYELNSLKTLSQRALEELQKEHKFLNLAKERFGKSINLSGPKLNPENFQAEIVQLTAEVNQLNKHQEELKRQAVREQENLRNLRAQVDLAIHALATYDKDSSYLRNHQSEGGLTCPTCGAEHTDAFMDMLTYAEDARILRELVIRLKDDEKEALEKYKKTANQIRELHTNYHRVSNILDTRRGELQFRDVVTSVGAESAARAFQEESDVLKTQIDGKLSEIEEYDRQLKELVNMQRSKSILQLFRNAYSSSLIKLNLPPINTARVRLTSRPNVSGSGGPRSLLAYYGALWETCLSDFGNFSIPLVIDAPNQQGQDDINLPKVLSFIADELPAEAQIIVSTEMETNNSFDNTIRFDRPYNLLDEDLYEELSVMVEPLWQRMNQELSSHQN